MFGFTQTTLTGSERTSSYSVNVGFLSGYRPNDDIVFTVQPNYGTASKHNSVVYHTMALRGLYTIRPREALGVCILSDPERPEGVYNNTDTVQEGGVLGFDS